VIKRLNPIIRGWAAYYRTQVSAEVFGGLDHYLWPEFRSSFDVIGAENPL
jgi:hypothetical protein